MFGSEIIDVAVGVVFLFLMMSLICSAVIEMIEAILKKRATDLERGMKELISDPNMVANIYNHPLVNALFHGTYPAKNHRDLPTYIPSRTFALALMDLVAPAAAGTASGAAGAVLPPSSASPTSPLSPLPSTAALRTALAGLTGASEPLKKALLPLIDAAGTDPAIARQNIEDWYNASMDRVSGWFKRRTHFILFVIGLIFASIVNADTIAFTKYLSTDKEARAMIVAKAAAVPTPKPGATAPATKSGTTAPASKSGTTAPSVAGELSPAPKELADSLGWLEAHGGIPFGWHGYPAKAQDETDDSYNKKVAAFNADWRRVPQELGDWLVKIAGLLLTAFAVTLGAPFWFDVLNKFMVVRSTIKPKEKSPDEPSKA